MKFEHQQLNTGIHQFTFLEPHPPEIPAFTRSPLYVYISEPKSGINHETIPVLVLHGDGAMGTKEYLQSLHESLSSNCNFLIITVEYLGHKVLRSHEPPPLFFDQWCFNQTNYNFKLRGLPPLPTAILQTENPVRSLIHHLKTLDASYNSENHPLACLISKRLDDHYDFGVIQTIDCLWAIRLAKNHFPNIAWQHLTAAGISHGAYLATQCARFAPNTFALIVNIYGWVQPYLPWMLREHSGYLYNIEGIHLMLYLDNYWRAEPNHPFYLSPARLGIRTQNNIEQLQQWQQQQNGAGPLFIMTQQIDDEMHPRAEKELLVQKMKTLGFKMEDYLTPQACNHATYRSLHQDNKTSLKGIIYDFVTPERYQTNQATYSEFEQRNIISYQCDNSRYDIHYDSEFPTLDVVSNIKN